MNVTIKSLCAGFLVPGLLLTAAAVEGAWAAVDVIGIRAFTQQSEHFIGVRAYANPDSCTQPSVVVLMRDDAGNWKMVHSLLLAGIVAGKRLEVRAAGCHRDGYPLIDGARLLKD